MRYTRDRNLYSYRKRGYAMTRRRGTRRRKKRRKSRKMIGGGWSQFQTNVPRSAGYSSGGMLAPSLSALANPTPAFSYIR